MGHEKAPHPVPRYGPARLLGRLVGPRVYIVEIANDQRLCTPVYNIYYDSTGFLLGRFCNSKLSFGGVSVICIEVVMVS